MILIYIFAKLLPTYTRLPKDFEHPQEEALIVQKYYTGRYDQLLNGSMYQSP
jgi:hypothetical protein